MRSATSDARGVERRTNSSHSAASAERAQTLARSFIEAAEPFIAWDSSLAHGCGDSYLFANSIRAPGKRRWANCFLLVVVSRQAIPIDF
jgi:hypothetical protein